MESASLVPFNDTSARVDAHVNRPSARRLTPCRPEGGPLRLAGQLARDLRDVLALEAGHGEFAFAWLAAAVAAGDRAGAVGRATGDLVQPHLGLARIGQADDHHALVQQSDVEGEDGAFLPAVLRG